MQLLKSFALPEPGKMLFSSAAKYIELEVVSRSSGDARSLLPRREKAKSRLNRDSLLGLHDIFMSMSFELHSIMDCGARSSTPRQLYAPIFYHTSLSHRDFL